MTDPDPFVGLDADALAEAAAEDQADARVGVPAAPPARGPSRVSWLLASRLVEQGVLGVGALLLAGTLGRDAFAPVSILFVAYSLAVTAGGLGLGVAVLRHPAERTLARAARRRARQVDLAVAGVAVGMGLALGGDGGQVVAVGGLLWVLGAEAMVAKAVGVKHGRARETAKVEIASSMVLAAAVVAASIDTDHAISVVAVGLLAKVVLEAAVLGPAGEAFSADGDHPGHWQVWSTVMLAYAISNVDYAVVGASFSPAVLSVTPADHARATPVAPRSGPLTPLSDAVRHAPA